MTPGERFMVLVGRLHTARYKRFLHKKIMLTIHMIIESCRPRVALATFLA